LIDADLAALARSTRCSVCNGVLHAANYPRKPRGLPEELGVEHDRRHSFCCGSRDCRKRLTPPSVRFLDSRVYTSVVVVLVAAMVHGVNARRARALGAELGVDARTLERWRRWWQEAVPRTDFWLELRGRLDRPVDPAGLPCALLERMGGESEEERVLGLLHLIAPLSHSALMRRRFARAA
jgi:hypothetical protein